MGDALFTLGLLVYLAAVAGDWTTKPPATDRRWAAARIVGASLLQLANIGQPWWLQGLGLFVLAFCVWDYRRRPPRDRRRAARLAGYKARAALARLGVKVATP